MRACALSGDTIGAGRRRCHHGVLPRAADRRPVPKRPAHSGSRAAGADAEGEEGKATAGAGGDGARPRAARGGCPPSARPLLPAALTGATAGSVPPTPRGPDAVRCGEQPARHPARARPASQGPGDGGAREGREAMREAGRGKDRHRGLWSRRLRDAVLVSSGPAEASRARAAGARQRSGREAGVPVGVGWGTPTQSDCSGTTVRVGVWHVGWERR